MRRLTHLLVLGAFLFSCGGQWYALQCVAWVSMIHDYSRVVPLGEAVRMTFSGEYPCAICKAIADKQQSENSKVATLSKFEKKLCPTLAVVTARATSGAPQAFSAWLNSFSTRAEAPPTPPPRFA